MSNPPSVYYLEFTMSAFPHHHEDSMTKWKKGISVLKLTGVLWISFNNYCDRTKHYQNGKMVTQAISA